MTMRFSLLALGVCLAGCAGTTSPPVVKIVTRDVPVPFYQPCPAAKDIPTPPKTVHDEYPTMPSAPAVRDKSDVAGWIAQLRAGGERERILAAKVLEDRTYIETADRIMRACAAPKVTNPPG